MKNNKEYKTVQIPKTDYDLLKEYCGAMGFKIGIFVGKLIQANCISVAKKPSGTVLKVEKL